MTAVQRGEGRLELRGLNVTLISGGNETNTVRTTIFKQIISTSCLCFYTQLSLEIPVLLLLSYFPNLSLY